MSYFELFQSPRGDFGFLKPHHHHQLVNTLTTNKVSIPSRGFWFFEADRVVERWRKASISSFNPLAGILVF